MDKSRIVLPEIVFVPLYVDIPISWPEEPVQEFFRFAMTLFEMSIVPVLCVEIP